MEKYRRISLLNSFLFFVAAIMQARICNCLDPYLTKTQYGFRKNRGTAQALQCVRRIAEYAEITGGKLLLVLLDWGMAFDKVTREGLFHALEGLNLPEKYVRIIKSLYSKPTFKVEMDGLESKWYDQVT